MKSGSSDLALSGKTSFAHEKPPMDEMTNKNAPLSAATDVGCAPPTSKRFVPLLLLSSNSVVARYGLAILLAVASLLLRRLLDPLLGPQNTFHTAWAAVVFTSWYCGLGPAVLAEGPISRLAGSNP